MYLGVGGNLALLFYFKYFNFFTDNLQSLGILGEYPFPIIALPIGISFFVFQSISYIVDVYNTKIEKQKNILLLGLYISLFPQLIAGPIVRYGTIAKDLMHRAFDAAQFKMGIDRFIIGLAKKIIIADQLAIIADAAFDGNIGLLSTSSAWLGLLTYSLQIYFDFSGYSDMAIGLGLMLGFRFPENFNLPYLSQSVREFWRRWHITLSTWFRDYLYIPLGGSKGSIYRTYFNLTVVFLITGLWHGASWNFLIWGMMHGVFLILERIGLTKLLMRLPSVVSWCYTTLAVVLAWVWFRANDFWDALYYFKALFSFRLNGTNDPFLYLNVYSAFILGLGILIALPFINVKRWQKEVLLLKRPILFLIFIYCLSEISASSYSPFIYFRF